jgi:hypothetical protein
VDVTPILSLIAMLVDALQRIAVPLAGLSFLGSAIQLLVAVVIGSSRGQEVAKAGMVGSVVGLVGAFYGPQIIATVHAAFGS